MPCNEIRLTTINLAQANRDLLLNAIVGMGFTTQTLTDGGIILFMKGASVGTVRGGVVTLRDSLGIGQQQVVQAYANEVVKAAGQRAGWAVKSSKENQYVLTRGRR